MGNVQTRQMDAKSMARRRNSIYWNFRYPSLTKRKEGTTTMVLNSQLLISDWLALLDLQQYESNFSMFNRVEDILDLDDDELKLKGVRNMEHRFKMLSSLVRVQAKRRQSMNIEAKKSPAPTLKRKNSCPPIYLTANTTIFDVLNESSPESATQTNQNVTATLKRNSYQRHSFTPKSNSPADRKRFTLNENDTIYEELRPHDKNSNSSSSKDNSSSSPEVMDNGGAFNSGSFNQPTSLCGTNTMTATNEHQEALALKKALEWELSLDSRDLRSHAWYHGPLSRQRAEEIVQRDGDFLIRDCTSQPDNYVLTCRSKTAVLHFVINKILVQPETVYERVQYQFEEEAFDTIPDLITFYVGSGKSISLASGALIQYPCNRNYPLSFYGHKIVGNQLHTQMLAGLRGASPLNSPMGNNSGFRFCGSGPTSLPMQPTHSLLQHQQSLPTNTGATGSQMGQLHSPMSSPPRGKMYAVPRLPSKKQQRSQSLTPAQAIVVSNMKNADAGNSADGVLQGNQAHAEAMMNNGNAACNNSGGGGSMINISTHANGNSFRPEVRRFIQLEKANSVCGGSPHEMQLHNHLENLSIHGKIPTNGFQTIARCTVGDMVENHMKFTTHSLPRPATTAVRNSLNRTSSLARDCNNAGEAHSHIFSSLEISKIPELPEKPPSPPPKPNRQVMNTLTRSNKEMHVMVDQQYPVQRHGMAGIYQLSGSDSGNGSGDSMPGDMSELIMQRGVIIKNPRFMSTSVSSVTLKSLTEFDVEAAEQQLFTLEIPEFKPVSRFDIENFSTLLLPSVENKPLDGDALNTFKMMLLETGPKMLAEHITRIDIGLLIEMPTNDSAESEISDNECNLLNISGLEMLTLPQGKLFRKDLIERTQCIKLMVAVTILTCQTDLDRAELLSKWIQIAVETKTALGNLFGFSAIMLGLCMPQIQKLVSAWHLLRQKYTDDAFMFEAKLRPTLSSMNECSNPQAPNTTVPHVLLHILLKDRSVMDILNFNNTTEKSSLYQICITSWESKADDFGMYINYAHLEASRNFLNNLKMYRKNSKIILEESAARLDELLSDAFRTEFHVKFLWGSKGALATADDRHSKLEKVLALMADKFCNADNGQQT